MPKFTFFERMNKSTNKPTNTLCELVRNSVERFASKIAFTMFEGEEITYAEAGRRIEKVQQPARDQVVLALRGNQKLLLCAGASQARIHFTHVQRENPAAPPMFCMLLRKPLQGGRLTGIDQPGLERAVALTVDITDELGERGQRRLVKRGEFLHGIPGHPGGEPAYRQGNGKCCQQRFPFDFHFITPPNSTNRGIFLYRNI